MANAKNNAQYTYHTAEGQITIPVTAEMYQVLIDLDRQERNNDQTHRRRSLNSRLWAT